ncbi:hypothetical protein [Actinomadura harenae]|uniref:hypothetical protein n=1 Tax=Actinomadura harenae TaxID=2483351 RepID=UPI00131561C8|nr:hypothetical protein [Actinomadura harenae]
MFRHSWDGGYQSDQDQAEGYYEAAVDPTVSGELWDGHICSCMITPQDARYLP